MPQRDVIVLGVGPNDFLIRAEGDEAAVREGLARLMPKVSFELSPVNDRTASQLESRLTEAQVKLATRFNGEAGVKRSRRLTAYRMQLTDPSTGVVATATAAGKLKFSPRITEVRKPLGGGIGPVGVTVGVGIAGKF
jgi:hypothetical protein